MNFFSFLAAVLLLRRIQKTLRYTPLHAKWNVPLNIALVCSIVLYLSIEFFFNDTINVYLANLLLLAVLLFVNREEDFRNIRFFLPPHYPLMVMGFINMLTEVLLPKFYHRYEEYFQIAVLLAFFWIFARWANSRKQQEELKLAFQKNEELDRLVAERTAELTKQKDELQEALKLLQATQAQLVQQEKLASLGELTAGIAHEIQNPLNFVNNFSEVSMELLDEMVAELDKGDTEEVIALATDVRQNLEKIMFHGKRADGIVKGMLQHSRISNGQKEETNINTLADEYFRLAYHGLRAKDKSFNAELVTHFSDDLPLLKVIPQDIGRVLLNLFTNAFYATKQRQGLAGLDYKPSVTVSTALKGLTVQIKVRDNGVGIPDEIKDKILQPFFTTKPTGVGTGLGLSISHDIIVKGHGGTLSIETKENEFTEFTVQLPLR